MQSAISKWVSVCLLVMASIPSAYAADKDYEACSRLSQSDPKAALAMANKLIQQKNSRSAKHCRAISLYALGRYSEAAQSLAQVAALVPDAPNMLWFNLIRQQAMAHKQGGDAARAIIALTDAYQKVEPYFYAQDEQNRIGAEILLERSLIYQAAGRFLFAVQDMDQAISLQPELPSLRLARAKLLQTQGLKAQAEKDIRYVLARNPSHPEALQLQRR